MLNTFTSPALGEKTLAIGIIPYNFRSPRIQIRERVPHLI
jgi:hypothetical protein